MSKEYDLRHTGTFVGLRRSKCGGTLGIVEGLLVGWTFGYIQHLLQVERSARREIQEVVWCRSVAIYSFSAFLVPYLGMRPLA